MATSLTSEVSLDAINSLLVRQKGVDGVLLTFPVLFHHVLEPVRQYEWQYQDTENLKSFKVFDDTNKKLLALAYERNKNSCEVMIDNLKWTVDMQKLTMKSVTNKTTSVKRAKLFVPCSKVEMDHVDTMHMHKVALYACLTKSEFLVVDPKADFAPYRGQIPKEDAAPSVLGLPMLDKPDSTEEGTSIALVDRSSGTDASSINASTQASAGNPYIILGIPYHFFDEVIADSMREDVFGLSIREADAAKIPYVCPLALRFSSAYRKTFLERLQICHNLHHILSKNQAASLPLRFAPLHSNWRAKAFSDTSITDKRLATFQYFSHMRMPKELHCMKPFYRNGYIFLGPDDMLDKYEALPNRPCSTYFLETSDQSIQDKSEKKGKEPPYLVVKFLAERSMSHMCSLTRSRDLDHWEMVKEGDNREAEAVDKGTSVVNPRTNLSKTYKEICESGSTDLELKFWVESMAQAIAMDACGGEDFFIPQRGPYHKKMNPVGDKAAWTVYRVHIFTRTREIGVVGLRRSFMPPHLDTYQDMLFVLYGGVDGKLKPQPEFMQTMYNFVDTLSPALPPVPYDKNVLLEAKILAALTKKDYKKLRQLRSETIHPTYVDIPAIQARANALLYNHNQYKWMSTRDFLYNEAFGPARGMHIPGIIPRTKFIDIDCYDLAIKFCISVYCKVMSGIMNEGDYEKERDELKPVADPMAILFRMMAAVDMDNGEDDEEDETKKEKVMYHTNNDQGSESGYSRKEEWKCRVAQYFAFCVDSGLLSGFSSDSIVKEERQGGKRSKKNKGGDVEDAGKDGDEGRERELSSVRLSIPLIVQCLRDNYRQMEASDVASLDESLDFLLYMKRKPKDTSIVNGGIPFEPARNIVDRIVTVEGKDTGFLASWSCNEHVLIRLIDAGYFHAASERFSNCAGLQARLFRSILLTKVYNLKLIRTVCESIKTALPPAESSILLEPLLNLAKIGNFMVKAWALGALAKLAESGFEQEMYSNGAVGMSIWNLYTSRNADVLESCLEMLLAVVRPDKLANLPYVILTQSDLIVRLVHMLAPYEQKPVKVGSDDIREKKKMKIYSAEERYHPRVLSLVSMLVVKLSADKSVLLLLLQMSCHHHLTRIVDLHEKYHPILVKITSALGNLYVHAGGLMTEQEFSKKEKVLVDANSLMKALKNHTTREKLQLCLNILIVIKNMLDWDIIPRRANENPRIRMQKITDRLEVFKFLSETGFAEAVGRCKTAALKVDKDVLGDIKAFKGDPDYERLDEVTRETKLKELYTWGKIAAGVLNKVKWFQVKADLCISCQWKTTDVLTAEEQMKQEAEVSKALTAK